MRKEITSAQKLKFLRLMSRGVSVADASKEAGFHTATGYRLVKNDPDAAGLLAEIRSIKLEMLEDALIDRAINGVIEKYTCGKGFIYDTKTGMPAEKPVYDNSLGIKLLDRLSPKFINARLEKNEADLPAELQREPEPEPDEPSPAKPIL